MRVHAIDAITGEEVQVTGPIHTPRAYLKKIATQKLMQIHHGSDEKEQKSKRFFLLNKNKPLNSDAKCAKKCIL